MNKTLSRPIFLACVTTVMVVLLGTILNIVSRAPLGGIVRIDLPKDYRGVVTLSVKNADDASVRKGLYLLISVDRSGQGYLRDSQTWPRTVSRLTLSLGGSTILPDHGLPGHDSEKLPPLDEVGFRQIATSFETGLPVHRFFIGTRSEWERFERR